jgi:hypothetical protein
MWGILGHIRGEKLAMRCGTKTDINAHYFAENAGSARKRKNVLQMGHQRHISQEFHPTV